MENPEYLTTDQLIEQAKEKAKSFPYLLESLKERIASDFDIENLSVIESARLKEIVQEYFKENQANFEKTSEVGRWGHTTPYLEIFYRWFWELYGINLANEIKGKNISKELKSRIKFLREQAHNPSLE